MSKPRAKQSARKVARKVAAARAAALDSRERAVTARERAADERDSIANARDRAAAERDAIANARDRAAAEHGDGGAGLAGARGDGTSDGEDPELARAAEPAPACPLDALTGPSARGGQARAPTEIEPRPAGGRTFGSRSSIRRAQCRERPERHAAGDRVCGAGGELPRTCARTTRIVRFGGTSSCAGSRHRPDEVRTGRRHGPVAAACYGGRHHRRARRVDLRREIGTSPREPIRAVEAKRNRGRAGRASSPPRRIADRRQVAGEARNRPPQHGEHDELATDEIERDCSRWALRRPSVAGGGPAGPPTPVACQSAGQARGSGWLEDQRLHRAADHPRCGRRGDRPPRGPAAGSGSATRRWSISPQSCPAQAVASHGSSPREPPLAPTRHRPRAGRRHDRTVHGVGTRRRTPQRAGQQLTAPSDGAGPRPGTWAVHRSMRSMSPARRGPPATRAVPTQRPQPVTHGRTGPRSVRHEALISADAATRSARPAAGR